MKDPTGFESSEGQEPKEPKMMNRANPKLAVAFGKALKTLGFFCGICLVLFVWTLAIVSTFHFAGPVAGVFSLLVLALFIVTIHHYFDS